MTSVPAMQARMAFFLVFLKEYTAEAGMIRLQPTTKFARSPMKAVEVPFMHSFSSIFTNSIMTPATGPKAKEPTKIGSSLKSIL